MRPIFWLNNARYVSFPQSLLPAFVAVALAFGQPGFSWGLSLLAVFGCVMAHFGFNILDDYFDFRNNDGKVREKLAGMGMRSRIAKCSYITSGEADIIQTRNAALVFLSLAAVSGAVIWYCRDFDYRLALIVALALVLGYSYSGKPLALGYYGFGELVIGSMFGPLLMSGTYISACGDWSNALLMVSLATGMLVMNIVYSHSVVDRVSDAAIGKMTFARILRGKAPMLAASALMIFLPFMLVIAAVEFFGLSRWNYMVFVILPWAIVLYRYLYCFVYETIVDETPRWWMGPMERWDLITQAGIGWFMIRWYLARNLLSMFCVVLIVVNFLV